MPIASYAMIPETPDGRNRIFAAPPGKQGPEEIILQRFQLTPAVSLSVGGLPLSCAGQSRVAANTTTRRQEVDENWTDFNLQLIIDL
jgi:hypothetical protein